MKTKKMNKKEFKSLIKEEVKKALKREESIENKGLNISTELMSELKDILKDPEFQNDFGLSDDIEKNMEYLFDNKELLKKTLEGLKSNYEHDIEMERNSGEDASYLMDTYEEINELLQKIS